MAFWDIEMIDIPHFAVNRRCKVTGKTTDFPSPDYGWLLIAVA